MESKLLYKYPEKQDRQSERILKLEASQKNKKAKKKLFFSLAAGAVIILVALLSSISWFKIPMILVGIYSAAISYFGYKLNRQSFDIDCYTKIYSDRLEHCQNELASLKKRVYVIKYENIEKTVENNLGGLKITLKNASDCIYVISGNGDKAAYTPKKNEITLYFQSFEIKQYLKINMKKEIVFQSE